MSVIDSYVAGHTKKLTVQAIIFVCHGTGSLVGPQLYTKPPYRMGFRANVVVVAFGTGCGMLHLAYLIWEKRNRRQFLKSNRHLLNENDYKFRQLTYKENTFFFNNL